MIVGAAVTVFGGEEAHPVYKVAASFVTESDIEVEGHELFLGGIRVRSSQFSGLPAESSQCR